MLEQQLMVPNLPFLDGKVSPAKGSWMNRGQPYCLGEGVRPDRKREGPEAGKAFWVKPLIWEKGPERWPLPIGLWGWECICNVMRSYPGVSGRGLWDQACIYSLKAQLWRGDCGRTRAKADRPEGELSVAWAISESHGDRVGKEMAATPTSLLGNPTGREAWWATVQGATEELELDTAWRWNNSNVETEMNRLETEFTGKGKWGKDGVWQKPAQYCKAIILWLKTNF